MISSALVSPRRILLSSLEHETPSTLLRRSGNQSTKSAVNDIQSLFNRQGGQKVLKMWASMNERMTSLIVEAGTRSIDIMSNASKEALSNLRDATQVRDEPAEYGKAYSDFARKHMELLKRAAQDVGELTQKAGSATAELASKASEELSDKCTANAKETADTASVAKKTA